MNLSLNLLCLRKVEISPCNVENVCSSTIVTCTRIRLDVIHQLNNNT
jgi:hypothetical protein